MSAHIADTKEMYGENEMTYPDTRIELYKESIKLAEEYIKRANATIEKTLVVDKRAFMCSNESACSHSQENASTKRCSMELSKILVKMRR